MMCSCRLGAVLGELMKFGLNNRGPVFMGRFCSRLCDSFVVTIWEMAWHKAFTRKHSINQIQPCLAK